MEAKMFGVMLDCSRDAVYSVESLKNYIDILAKMGYNTLQLYTEDTYEIKEEPYFGYLRGRYTTSELKELDDYAYRSGVELMPCIQTLAHLGGFARWKPEMIDFNDILLADDENTYALIDNMFKTCAECFRSRRINIGMDEAHMVGLGKYLDKHGYKNRTEILVKHLNKVCEIADKYGFKPMMWSDMFFRLACHGAYYAENVEFAKEIIDLVPKNVDLVYWDYYHNEKQQYDSMLKAHKQFNNKTVFAGGAWSWIGFVPNNTGTMPRHEAAIEACIENGIDDILITTWHDDGAECSLYATLPALFHAAQVLKGNSSIEGAKDEFEKIVGISFDDFMAVDLPDRIDDDTTWTNPCKYMLYSDPFLGIFDKSVDESKTAKFAQAKKKLAKGAKNEKYGYIFKTLASLCDIMEIKYTLGIRTRRAYRKNDKTELEKLIGDYELAGKRVKKFYDNFRTQWHVESKGNGFEKHSARLGGLMCRLGDCKQTLKDYCVGKITKIDELEEDILSQRNTPDGKALLYNRYFNIALIKPDM